MNKEDVLKFIEELKRTCACGETEFWAADLDDVDSLLTLLRGEPIYHLGLLGCCHDVVVDDDA